MTKSELIARLAARNPHLYQRDVERIVATVFDEISKALAGGHRVELRGFGAFSVKKREPRTGQSAHWRAGRRRLQARALFQDRQGPARPPQQGSGQGRRPRAA